MGANLTDRTTVRDDPRYREGMAHLQAGEWPEAIGCFEELLQEHPQSGEVQRALEGARFKAELDGGGRVKARRWAIPWRSVIVGALILLATVAIGLGVVNVVQGSILPGLEEAQRDDQRARWLGEGQEHLRGGELVEAQSAFAKVLEQTPGHQEALQGLEAVAEQRLLRVLYQQAVALQDGGEPQQALEVFAEISRRSPEYRDVSERIDGIERRKSLETLFAEAEAAYEDDQAVEAVAAYERVRDRNVSYRRELIDERLFELYMQLGREIVAQPPASSEGAPGPAVLSAAIDYFSRAVKLRPSSAEAAVERELAVACAEGLRAYQDRQWDTATARLQAVFEERPNYLGGAVVDTLYQAYVGSAERYEEAGNLQRAYDDYQRAIQLPVDAELARDRADALAPQLTPTPTPTPTRTPMPSPTPEPTSVWQGNAVQEDQNLLANPSFEGGWTDMGTGQAPRGWRILWLDGERFPGAASVARAPETVVGQKRRFPADERSLFFRDGAQNLKVFKAFTPMYAALVQDVSGLDEGRRYRLTVPIYVDMYQWEGDKVAASSQAGRIRLGAGPQGATWRDEGAITYSGWWDGTNTADFYLQYSEFSFDFEAAEPDMTVYIEMVGVYGLTNNGFFLDDLALYPLGEKED